MNTTNMSSLGSTQKYVPPAPPQLYSPTEPAKGETQAEAETRARKIERARRHRRAQVVRRHVGHGLGAEDALAVEGASVQQHLAEARVVHGRADHAAPAGFRGLGHSRIIELRVDADAAVVGEGLGDPALLGLVRD